MTTIVAYRRQLGLTLIELCTVILLLVIGASIAVPAFQALLERQRSATTLKLLSQHLDYTRLQSLQRSQNMRLCPIGEEVVPCGTDWSLGWQVVDAENKVLLHAPLEDQRQRLLWSMPHSSAIVYQGNGTTRMGNGTFTLCGANRKVQWVLVLNRQGRLRQRAPEQVDLERCQSEAG